MSHYKDSFHHSKRRFVDNASLVVDPLLNDNFMSYADSVYPRKRRLASQGTASLGNVVTYQLPSSGYLHELSVQNDFAQTTTQDVIPYVGCACISRVQIRNGSEVLHDYDYVDALNAYLTDVGDEESITKIMDQSGGAAVDTTSGAISGLQAIIPSGWSGLMGCQPIALHKLDSRVEVEITYRTAAQITISGGSGAAISNSKIICWMSDAGDNLKSKHRQQNMSVKTIDFKTFKSTAVSTGSETDLDISGLSGLIKRLTVRASLSADIDSSTPIDYFNNQVMTDIKTLIDGDEEIVFDNQYEGGLDAIIYNQGKPQSSTLGYIYTVPYTLHTEESKKTNVHNTGGLHSSKVNKNQLRVTHSLGENAEIGVCGLVATKWEYKNGQIFRLQ